LAKRRSKFTPRVKEPEYNINRRIRVTEVRIVGSNLKEISDKYGQTIESGIYPTKQALAIAEAVEMDLVEISAKAKPPVARIVDYSKFLYEKKKREKEIKSNAQKTVIKEIRFGPNTDDHDFQFKLRHAQKFLEEGAKVKAFVQFRGRSIVFKERGELLLLRFIEALTKIGQPEALPKMEGRRMFVFVAPKKIPKKVVKSSKKDGDKSKKVAKNTPEEVKNRNSCEVRSCDSGISTSRNSCESRSCNSRRSTNRNSCKGRSCNSRRSTNRNSCKGRSCSSGRGKSENSCEEESGSY